MLEQEEKEEQKEQKIEGIDRLYKNIIDTYKFFIDCQADEKALAHSSMLVTSMMY